MPNENTVINFKDLLSNDIWIHVFSSLSEKELNKVKLVCKDFYNLLNDPLFEVFYSRILLEKKYRPDIEQQVLRIKNKPYLSARLLIKEDNSELYVDAIVNQYKKEQIASQKVTKPTNHFFRVNQSQNKFVSISNSKIWKFGADNTLGISILIFAAFVLSITTHLICKYNDDPCPATLKAATIPLIESTAALLPITAAFVIYRYYQQQQLNATQETINNLDVHSPLLRKENTTENYEATNDNSFGV